MTLQWIPLGALEPHPENSNRMPAHLTEKLKGHIQRTGLYEPLVVRPMPIRRSSRDPVVAGMLDARESRTAGEVPPSQSSGLEGAALEARGGAAGNDLKSEISDSRCRYQILNGHHRAQVLRDLGHSRARCDVWEVDDDEARLLLATLNRLEGRDDPSARAHLVSRLAECRSAEDLSRLLPEPPDAVERLLRLAQPPAAPLAPEALEPIARPMTFFLADEQHALVTEALREVGHGGTPPGDGVAAPRPKRAEALERLALWYLESRGLR
jgi:hypothetical protein